MVKERMEKITRDQRPHFFKLMLPGREKGPLRIPPNFVKNILKKESGEAILKGPTSGLWSIKLSKTMHGMYFQDGWQEFASTHSLGDCEFLLFRYDGNMKFKVIIFDKSGCERDYVSCTGKCEASSFSNGAKNPIRQSRSFTSSADLSQSEMRNRDPGQTFLSPKPDEMNKFEENALLSIHEMESRRRTEAKKGKQKVQEATEPFNSNLPYFSKILGSGNAKTAFVLDIPYWFGHNHLPIYQTNITLLNPEGQSWKVKLLYLGRSPYFSGGWKAFVRDNMLTQGDTCIFELVDEAKMQVHISRVIKET